MPGVFRAFCFCWYVINSMNRLFLKQLKTDTIMTSVDLLGYFAALGTTCAFIPQAYKVYKTKHTSDLSLGTFLMFCAGLFLWVIYGFVVSSTPIILANSLTCLMVFYILVMIIKYGKKKASAK